MNWLRLKSHTSCLKRPQSRSQNGRSSIGETLGDDRTELVRVVILLARQKATLFAGAGEHEVGLTGVLADASTIAAEGCQALGRFVTPETQTSTGSERRTTGAVVDDARLNTRALHELHPRREHPQKRSAGVLLASHDLVLVGETLKYTRPVRERVRPFENLKILRFEPLQPPNVIIVTQSIRHFGAWRAPSRAGEAFTWGAQPHAPD